MAAGVRLLGGGQTTLLRAGQASQIVLATNTFSGTSTSTTYTATLGDGSPLPSWLALNSSTGTLSVAGSSQSGTYDVLITASDGSSHSAPAIETLVVSNGITLTQQLP